MPEIALCRNCTACADFTPMQLAFVDSIRLLRIKWAHPDDVFALELESARWVKMLSTKKLSEPE
jgi:hypothetical protein